ncbi:MAG: leucine-rich repeat protein [Bacilli bacterium]|nr:leucine-rich repeat protein [Bacilli bacterium]MDD4808975.1 leucine-rich repeat protein [Bacilli bacterium]
MKKGFTLIELLGVVILLGVIALLVVPTINKVIKDSKDNAYNQQVKTIENSARKWSVVNNDEISEINSTFLSIQDLINGGYVKQDEIIDPRDSSIIDGCVVIKYQPSNKNYIHQYFDESCSFLSDKTILKPSDSEYLCYTFDEATLTITNYDAGCSKDIIIPAKIQKNDTIYDVKYIGGAAFDNKQLTSVVIPEGVLGILDGSNPNGAFKNNLITKITLPSTLTTIGNHAFSNNQLTNVSISDGVLIIGISAFEYNQISNLDLGNTVKTLKSQAFKYNELTNLIIPDSVTNLDYEAFSYNNITTAYLGSSLNKINMDGNVRNISIGGNIFAQNPLVSLSVSPSSPYYTSVNNAIYSKDLTTLILGIESIANNILPGITSIGHAALAGLDLSSITIPNSVTTIKECAFAGNNLTSLILPDGLTNIPKYMVIDNEITNIIIPSGVTEIGDYALRSNKFSSIIIPNGVTRIGDGAFSSNDFTSINIPNSVTYIGNSAFKFNLITQGNAKIDNKAINVTVDPTAFNQNGLGRQITITPVFLRD